MNTHNVATVLSVVLLFKFPLSSFYTKSRLLSRRPKVLIAVGNVSHAARSVHRDL